MKNSLFAGKKAVNTVTEFMGKCCDVAWSRCPIEQHVRVMGGYRIRTERSPSLAGANRSINPPLVNKSPDNPSELGRETRVGLTYDCAAFLPAD